MVTFRTDNAGNTPEVGDYVAYNWSGNIATGYIVRIGKTKSGHSIFHIERVLPELDAYHRDNRSVVRGGAKCVLVLQKGDSSQVALDKPPGA